MAGEYQGAGLRGRAWSRGEVGRRPDSARRRFSAAPDRFSAAPDDARSPARWAYSREVGRNALLRARLERVYRLAEVQEYRLRAALNALEEFEARVAAALDDFDDFSEVGSRDNSNGAWPKSQASRLKHVLDDIFKEMLAEDNNDDWVVTLDGLRIPRLDEINERLRELGVQMIREPDLERMYIGFVDGD